jgi:pyruvate-formate lyase-activating enzyme
MKGPICSVLHLHPLRRCNLQCHHCYSDSSPQAGELMAAELALETISRAAQWGYTALSVSGGEPMLYPWLPELLEHAKQAGMSTSLVTNGLLCRTPADIRKLRAADTVTVSIDGLSANHDRMRARDGAFAGACLAIRRLVDAGVPTRIGCGLTGDNAEEVEELIAQAIAWGVQGISFHVVERAGRANSLAQATFLPQQAQTVLYAAINLLAAVNRHLLDIRIDLLHRDNVLRRPHLLYADIEGAEVSRPSTWLRVLIAYPDGRIGPVCHGFPMTSVQVKCDAFFEQAREKLAALGKRAMHQLATDASIQVLNPDDWLAGIAQGAWVPMVSLQ